MRSIFLAENGKRRGVPHWVMGLLLFLLTSACLASSIPAGDVENTDQIGSFFTTTGEEYIPGIGFNTLKYSPKGVLCQLTYDDSVGGIVYWEKDTNGQWTKQKVFVEQAQRTGVREELRAPAALFFDVAGKPNVIIKHYSDSTISWYCLKKKRWVRKSFSYPLMKGGSTLLADMGKDGSLHIVMTTGSDSTDFWGWGNNIVDIYYGHQVKRTWQWEKIGTVEKSNDSGLNYFSAEKRICSMVIDNNNHVHLVYTPKYTFASSELVYATNVSGSWAYKTLVKPLEGTEGDAGFGVSIAIDHNGNIAVANQSIDRVTTGSAISAKLLYLTKDSMGNWTEETVVTQSDNYDAGDGINFTGSQPYLAFDRYNSPHIAFCDYASTHFQYIGADEFAGQIRHAYKSSEGNWELQTVYPQSEPISNMMNFPLIAISDAKISFAGLKRKDTLSANYMILSIDYRVVEVTIDHTDK